MLVKNRAAIPDEAFSILEWQDEGLPAICVVNQSLANFEQKAAFAWHLTIIIICEAFANQGMPTIEETTILDRFGQELDRELKADGNGLFLARTTCDGTRQLDYRVHDPEVANHYLSGIIEAKSFVRAFKYEMERDDEWQHAADFLKHWETEAASP